MTEGAPKDTSNTRLGTLMKEVGDRARPYAVWAGKSIKQGLESNDHVIEAAEQRLREPHDAGLNAESAIRAHGRNLVDAATAITRRTLALPFKIAEAYIGPFTKPKEPTEVYKAGTPPAQPPPSGKP